MEGIRQFTRSRDPMLVPRLTLIFRMNEFSFSPSHHQGSYLSLSYISPRVPVLAVKRHFPLVSIEEGRPDSRLQNAEEEM